VSATEQQKAPALRVAVQVCLQLLRVPPLLLLLALSKRFGLALEELLRLQEWWVLAQRELLL